MMSLSLCRKARLHWGLAVVVFKHAAFRDIQERLEREFNMTVITTVPNVSYHGYTKKEPYEIVMVNNPSDLPDPSFGSGEEPFIKASIITKSEFVGNVMSLCIESAVILPIKPTLPQKE